MGLVLLIKHQDKFKVQDSRDQRPQTENKQAPDLKMFLKALKEVRKVTD